MTDVEWCADLQHAFRRQCLQQCSGNPAFLCPSGQLAFRAMPFAPAADESGLQDRDYVGISAQDRRELADVAQHLFQGGFLAAAEVVSEAGNDFGAA